MTYQERFDKYEKEKRKLQNSEISGKEYERKIQELAKNLRI